MCKKFKKWKVLYTNIAAKKTQPQQSLVPILLVIGRSTLKYCKNIFKITDTKCISSTLTF